MKRIVIYLIFLLLPALDTTAQSYRVWYSYQYKTDKESERYRGDMDMKVDVSDGKAVWYSEKTFLRDSLMQLAFNEDGTINQKIYNELVDHPGTGEGMVTFLDFNGRKLTQCRKHLWVLINGDADLETPQWEITDETTVSREGYNVRKAVADYMGRSWTVWYTEEVPLPYGPWLFYGLPGLIIMATDSEELFIFRYMGMEEIDSFDRYDTLWGWRHTESNKRDRDCFNYSLEDAEKMYMRLHTDSSYNTEITGITELSATDRSGNPVPPEGYIPLIPSKYWKTRK